MGGWTTGLRLAALPCAWLGGIALQLQQRELTSASAYVAFASAALLAIVAAAWMLRRGHMARRQGAFVLALGGFVALGFAWAGVRALDRVGDELPAVLEGRDLQVVGTIASLPQRGSSGLRFRFAVEAANTLQGEAVTVPATLALGWYVGWHEDATLSPPQQELRAGQRWRFTLRLRRPHGHLNPHGFDYELQLFEQGVRATGYVRDAPPAERLADAAGHPVERLRQRVRDAIDAQVADRRAAGVLAALAVGDQSAIECSLAKVS